LSNNFASTCQDLVTARGFPLARMTVAPGS